MDIKKQLFSEDIPSIPEITQNPPDGGEGQESAASQSMEKLGTVLTNRDNISISSITLIGQIEGHYILPPQNKTTKYEHLLPLLVSIEECADVHGVLMLLNTVGGDVEAGLAIAELICSMKKPTVSLVLGGGHSIGVPLAVAAKRSFIVPSATMTIHPVRMNGLVIGVEQSFSYFSKMQDRINCFITDNSGIKLEVLNSMMFKTGELSSDIGSIINGHEAVSCGLIDKIGGLSDAIEELRSMVIAERPLEVKKASEEPVDKQEANTQKSADE